MNVLIGIYVRSPNKACPSEHVVGERLFLRAFVLGNFVWGLFVRGECTFGQGVGSKRSPCAEVRVRGDVGMATSPHSLQNFSITYLSYTHQYYTIYTNLKGGKQ